MASAESVAAVIEAGGAHVPALMERLEARLGELARSHGPVLAEHAGSTIAAGGKRLRPLLVFVAAGPEPRDDDAVLRAEHRTDRDEPKAGPKTENRAVRDSPATG